MDLFLQLSGSDKVFVESLPYETTNELSLFAIEPSVMKSYYHILGVEEIKAIPAVYEEMCRTVGIRGIHALQTIPRERLQKHVSSAVDQLKQILANNSNSEYLVNYLKITQFLNGLSRAAVDINEIKELQKSSQHEVVRSTLNSFLPDEAGVARKVKYSMENTVTGRLTVESGPQILTVPASARKCLRSLYENGRVLQLDLVSAEPTMALHVNGTAPPSDVYKHIAGSILGGKVTRKQAKMITLCALYGQSAARLRSKLPRGVDPNTVIRRTKKFFGVEELVNELRTECKEGVIRNILGRPISLSNDRDHTLVSYYLQSSVAEAAISMFSDFINDSCLEIKPLFVIHDALVIDCDSAAAKELQGMEKLNVSLGEWQFRVAITQLSNN
jgi:hypothetical protein